MTNIEVIEKFKEAFVDQGLAPPENIVTDGNLQRYRANGDKRGQKSGWYVFHGGDLPAGAFGNWKDGETYTWCGKNIKGLSAAEQAAYGKRLDDARRQGEAQRQHEQDKAKQKAAKLWEAAKPATEHQYLINKGVSAHGLRIKGKDLLVPMRNSAGELQSLQFIAADGSKMFLKDGAVKATYHAIGKLNGTILICEGYATAATLHEVTGHAVACAFNAGNLMPVAQAMRTKYPNLKIIICGDNDMQTEAEGKGNPGVEKATAAAKAIGAYLAVPAFKVTTSNPTDFNDLASTEGHDSVREQVEAAKPVKAGNQDEQLIDELAKMSKLEYGKNRKDAAKKLGITVTILDEIVDDRLKPTNTTSCSTDISTECEPWPEPVEGLQLFNDIHTNLTKHIILPPGAAVSITLWIVLSYCFDAFLILPILALLSPEKRCGKTTLLLLLNGLVNNGRLSSNISPAAVYRIVQKYQPTLLTDEADTFFKTNEELRGIYNSGHTKEAAFIDRVNTETMEVERFSTWAPKAIAMIGKPKDTIFDRSIIITMSRRKRGEIIEKKKLTHYTDSIDVRRKALRWSTDNIEKLKRIEADVPDLGNDRMTDNWTPLFAIAEILGGDIPQQTKEAMMSLAGVHEDDESIGSMLLEDLRTIFNGAYDGKVSSEEIINKLIEMDERPWAEWRNGKPMTKPALARQLRKFDIKPKTIRIGGTTIKGYDLAQFEDVFIRYAPTPPFQTVTPSQVPKNNDIAHIQTVTQENDVTDKNSRKQLNLGDCCDVTDRNTPQGRDDVFLEENEVLDI